MINGSIPGVTGIKIIYNRKFVFTAFHELRVALYQRAPYGGFTVLLLHNNGPKAVYKNYIKFD